jgi:hypothetical protein
MDIPTRTRRRLIAIEVAGFASLFLAFLAQKQIERATSQRVGLIFILTTLLLIGLLWRLGRHFILARSE